MECISGGCSLSITQDLHKKKSACELSIIKPMLTQRLFKLSEKKLIDLFMHQVLAGTHPSRSSASAFDHYV